MDQSSLFLQFLVGRSPAVHCVTYWDRAAEAGPLGDILSEFFPSGVWFCLANLRTRFVYILRVEASVRTGVSRAHVNLYKFRIPVCPFPLSTVTDTQHDTNFGKSVSF